MYINSQDMVILENIFKAVNKKEKRRNKDDDDYIYEGITEDEIYEDIKEEQEMEANNNIFLKTTYPIRCNIKKYIDHIIDIEDLAYNDRNKYDSYVKTQILGRK